MATHSSILARKIPRREEPGGLESMGSAKNRTTEHAGTRKHGWNRAPCSPSKTSQPLGYQGIPQRFLDFLKLPYRT